MITIFECLYLVLPSSIAQITNYFPIYYELLLLRYQKEAKGQLVSGADGIGSSSVAQGGQQYQF
jgi:hypothetical protein